MGDMIAYHVGPPVRYNFSLLPFALCLAFHSPLGCYLRLSSAKLGDPELQGMRTLAIICFHLFRHSIRIHLTYAQLHFIATTADSSVLGRAMAHWTSIPLLGKKANFLIGQMKLEALWIISNASNFVCPVRFREALGSITQSLE